MRILNSEALTTHGNTAGRKIVSDIMEAALQAANPYNNAIKLLKLEGHILKVGNPEFEAANDPNSGIETIDLDKVQHVYVIGAGKGVQWVAKALEEVLGEHLTAGIVIAKHGDQKILNKIEVIFGRHPVPDEGCLHGCEKIIELSKDVTDNDLVFTIIGNGASSLLTLPEEGIELSDVVELTREMQITKGVPTSDLNIVRNHIDRMKGGKVSRLYKKAQQIHLVMTDANHTFNAYPRSDYNGLLKENIWLHNLPEATTFRQAIEVLKKYDSWDTCAREIRTFLTNATDENETVKYEEFINYRFRVFGIMPDSKHFLLAAKQKAKDLGFHSVILTQMMVAEAKNVAKVFSAIAKNVEQFNEPVKAPAVLLASGEMIVTVGNNSGIGGRNQEFALACAIELDGNRRIVIGSADTDGTDGPGGIRIEGLPKCLGGAMIDGYTFSEAENHNISLDEALNSHNTSVPLWKLNCGMEIESNISLQDLSVILIL